MEILFHQIKPEYEKIQTKRGTIYKADQYRIDYSVMFDNGNSLQGQIVHPYSEVLNLADVTLKIKESLKQLTTEK